MKGRVQVRALRAVGIGGGAFLQPGEVADVAPLVAAQLLEVGRAELVRPDQSALLRAALNAEALRIHQQGSRQAR